MTKQADQERDLFESERSFKLLVENVTDYALYMLDPSGGSRAGIPAAIVSKGMAEPSFGRIKNQIGNLVVGLIMVLVPFSRTVLERTILHVLAGTASGYFPSRPLAGQNSRAFHSLLFWRA